MRVWAIGVLATLAICSAAPAWAAAGLTASVWHNIPSVSDAASDSTLDTEQAYIAATAPDYTFTNTGDTFHYSDSNFTNLFLGGDASGAALTDAKAFQFSAIDQKGFIVLPVSTSYLFVLSNIYGANAAAARVYLDGSLIAEEDTNGSGLSAASFEYAHYLAAGSYAFEIFDYQTTGPAALTFDVSGAKPSYVTALAAASAAPEPASWALMIAGLGLLGAFLRRWPCAGTRSSGAMF